MANQRFELHADNSIVNPATGRRVAANATAEGAGLELLGCNGMGRQLFEPRYHTGLLTRDTSAGGCS